MHNELSDVETFRHHFRCLRTKRCMNPFCSFSHCSSVTLELEYASQVLVNSVLHGNNVELAVIFESREVQWKSQWSLSLTHLSYFTWDEPSVDPTIAVQCWTQSVATTERHWCLGYDKAHFGLQSCWISHCFQRRACEWLIKSKWSFKSAYSIKEPLLACP